VGSATLLIAASVWGERYENILDALRYSAFQVVSLMSTTGYATADYLQWSYFSQALLLMLMVVGGCSGSTGGGVKCIRAMLLLKQGYRELSVMIHPKAVIPLKIGTSTVPAPVSSAIFGFFFLFSAVAAATTLVLCAAGSDLVTSFSATISALSNVGPGLGEVGPLFNYGPLPQLSKVMLTLCMIIGRLEVMTVLVLFTGGFWSK
jgi:trk system potassium uptake protein TrkH